MSVLVNVLSLYAVRRWNRLAARGDRDLGAARCRSWSAGTGSPAPSRRRRLGRCLRREQRRMSARTPTSSRLRAPIRGGANVLEFIRRPPLAGRPTFPEAAGTPQGPPTRSQRGFERRASVRTTAATDATITAAPAKVVVVDCFVEDRPAERDCHDWVHIRVCRDPRDRRVLQQPRVGGEREPGAEDDQIGERDQRSRAELGGVEVADLADQRACQQTDSASEKHLPAARDERVARQRQPGRGDRAARPHRGGGHAGEQREQRRPAGLLAGQQQDGDAGEADEHGDDADRRHPVAERAAVEDHPQRHQGDQQRGHAGGHVDLGDADDRVGAHQQDADREAGQQLPPRRPQHRGAAPPAQEGEHRGAGEHEAPAGGEERRHGLDHDADAEVGRAPDQIDDPERGPDLPVGRGRVAGSGEGGGGHSDGTDERGAL